MLNQFVYNNIGSMFVTITLVMVVSGPYEISKAQSEEVN